MRRFLHQRSLMLTSRVAAVYSLIVALVLLLHGGWRLPVVPLESPRYVALRQQVHDDPGNAGLQAGLRELDRQLRDRYFRDQRFVRFGAGLLVGGLGVTLITGAAASILARPQPRIAQLSTHTPTDNTVSPAFLAVASLATGVIVLGWTLHVHRPNLLPATVASLDRPRATSSPAPVATFTPPVSAPVDSTPPVFTPPVSRPAVSEAVVADSAVTRTTSSVDATSLNSPEIEGTSKGSNLATASTAPSAGDTAEIWPSFRGHDGSGIAATREAPLSWDAAKGENIRWKSPIPQSGAGSPIVGRGRVFLTGAASERREVYCWDAETGQLLWQRDVSGPPVDVLRAMKVNPDAGFAGSTMATDGLRVYAMFATGDAAAFDFDGRPLWTVSLGVPKNDYGHASSLAIHHDRLVIQFDQGKRSEKRSRLMALEGTTGKPLWEVSRDVPNSWASPIVVEHEHQSLIITCGDPWVIAYAADDGREVWRANCLGGDVSVSPVFRDGVVYVVSDQAGVTALRCGGQGDVTETHVVWKADAGLPDTCSPLATADFFMLLTSYGLLTCYDRATGGTPLWEEDFKEDFLASPSFAVNHVYLVSRQGNCFTVEVTREGCHRIAEGHVGEECIASPAFCDGRIYLRGKENLFCIGTK